MRHWGMYGILLVALFSTPLAFAQIEPNQHDHICTPFKSKTGQTINCQAKVDSPAIEDLVIHKVYILYDEGNDAKLPASLGSCINFSPGAEDQLWVLSDAEGEPIAVKHLKGFTSTVQLDSEFGSGAPADVSIVSGGAVIIDPEDGDESPEMPVSWREVNSGASDSTVKPGIYKVMSCGQLMTSPPVDTVISESFILEQDDITGGQLGVVDSSALLIGGIQSSLIWLLPAAGIAGTGILIAKFGASKN